MPPTIRNAVEADLPALVGLLAQLSLDKPRERLGPPLQEAYGRAFEAISADPNQTLLVADNAGRLVGTVCVIVVPNLSYGGRPYAIVENVVVDGAARGRHVGQQLMQCAVEIAREAGCYKVSLTSNKTREGAHRFYGSLGFAASHTGFRLDL